MSQESNERFTLMFTQHHYFIYISNFRIPLGSQCAHTTQTARNKHAKWEGKGEASFDTPFRIQSHAESMKKIVEPFRIYQLTSTANPAQFTQLWPAGLAVLVSWQILKGSHDFLHTFSMALFPKWGVKNGFTFALEFFMPISDGLGSVCC